MWTSEKALGALLLLLSAHLSRVVAFDDKDAIEESCFDVTKIVTPDPDWFGSVDTWYHSLCGRLKMYRDAREVMEGTLTRTLDEILFHDFCPMVQIKFDGGKVDYSDKITYTLSGFNGRKRKFVGKSVRPGHWALKSSWSKGSNSQIYMVMTDDKSFVFFLDCFNDDNKMSWFVLTTKPKLSAEAERKIHDKAKELGFKGQLFEQLRYDVCSVGGKHEGKGVNALGIAKIGRRSSSGGEVSENGGGNGDAKGSGNGDAGGSEGESTNKAESSANARSQMQVKVNYQAKGKS